MLLVCFKDMSFKFLSSKIASFVPVSKITFVSCLERLNQIQFINGSVLLVAFEIPKISSIKVF